MVYDPVQERREELRELEPKAPTVDPWELLRGLEQQFRIFALRYALPGNFISQSNLLQAHQAAFEALKQHDAERESDGT